MINIHTEVLNQPEFGIRKGTGSKLKIGLNQAPRPVSCTQRLKLLKSQLHWQNHFGFRGSQSTGT